jgi:hypothetical protein
MEIIVKSKETPISKYPYCISLDPGGCSSIGGCTSVQCPSLKIP